MNLNEIKEALSKATPGPWEWRRKKREQHEDDGFYVGDLAHWKGVNGTTILDVHKNKHGISEISAWSGHDVLIIANATQWIASLIEHYEECRDDAVTLHKQVEEMQKTLEFYGNAENWELPSFGRGHSPVVSDKGERARQTLQSLKEDKP